MEQESEESIIEDYPEKLTVLQYALWQYTSCDNGDVPKNLIEAFIEKKCV